MNHATKGRGRGNHRRRREGYKETMPLAGERDSAGSSARGRGVYSRATVGRAFSSSYLAGEAAAAAFLPRDFRQRAVRVAAARQAAERRVDATLLAALAEQQAVLPASAARE